MKPHDPPRRSTAERQVRAQLDAHLGWIGGWPVGGGRWQVVPPPGKGPPSVRMMTPQIVARGSRCWAKSTGPYREAFSRAVPHPAAWEALVPARLLQARAAIDGAPADVPEGAEQAIRVALGTSPDLDAALAWWSLHKVEMTALPDPVRQVQLAWLGARHGAPIEPLLTLLTGAEPPLTDDGIVGRLKAAVKAGTPPPDLPVGTWKSSLFAWLDTAWAERDGPRGLALQWLPLAWPLPVVDALTRWWDAVESARRPISGLAARVSRRLTDSHTDAARGRAKELVSSISPPPPRLCVDALDHSWVLARAGVAGASGVAWLGMRGVMRPASLMRLWTRHIAMPSAARLFSRIAFDLGESPALEALWPRGEDGLWWGPALDALSEPDPSGAWAFVRTLHTNVGLGVDEVDTAMELHTLEPSFARARALALKQANMLAGWHPERSLKLAARVAQGDAGGFVAMLEVLHREGERVEPALRFLGVDAVRMSHIAGRKALRRCAADLDLSRVLGCVIPSWPARTEVPLPQALLRYPRELYPPLQWLSAVHADPEKGASAVLDATYPPAQKLHDQLQVLQQRNDPGLAAHVLRLEQRIAEAPSRLSTAQAAKFTRKLEEAALRATFATWSETLHAHTKAARARRWGDQPGLERTRTTAILSGVARLQAPYPGLVDRLLHARKGSRPWDLRDDPAHQELLQRWRAQGLDPGPWLDPPVHSLQVGDATLQISVATDPLDVLWMGGAFDTCLSPGQCNFFSAVTNAADLDKHVLVAWRGGEMVARALIAIDEAGSLLTFQPYGKVAGFEAAVRTWATAVATAMGTVVGRGGTVRPRLAPRWYDDGVVDLYGEVGFFGLDEAFATLHAGVSPDAFVELVEGRLGPLNPMLARGIVSTRAVRNQPSWALGLLRWLSPKALDRYTARQLIWLLLRAGHAELAWTYGYAEAIHLPQTLREGGVDAELVELWVRNDPVSAQRALRRSPRRLHDLRGVWALALRALGRPRQAERLEAGFEP